jgi:signal peptidase II
MQKENFLRGKWPHVIFGVVALLIILADQLTKWWIKTHLELGQSLLDIGYFRIIHIYNTGAILGIFSDYTFALAIFSFVGVVVILLLMFVLRGHWLFLNSLLVRVAFGLVMGGTIGNLLDRALPPHRVTDFLDFKIWPAFNIADAAVTIGVILIIYRLIISLDVRQEE